MPLKVPFLIVGLCFTSLVTFSQAIDNTASFRIINASSYVRLHYENDYFSATDYYYTQGINLEVVNPSYQKFPLSKLLFTPKDASRQFGISIEHNGYTPTSIEHNEILYGDRPFAATLMLKTFSMSTNPVKRYRVTSSLTLGVIGPAAGGHWMQQTIHRWIHDTDPLGWQNQIQNDVVVNYEVGIEKNFARSGRTFLLNGFADARVGTLNTKLSTGVVFMVGKLNAAIASAFSGIESDIEQKEKFRFHFYVQPMVNAIGYDATMQGGVFNQSSPYTISSSDLTRITLQANYGVVLNYHAVSLEYFKTVMSKEFATGMNHGWGGLRIGVKL